MVAHHHFGRGDDNGAYLNVTFGTNDARALWDAIRETVYGDPQLREHMKNASMAMWSSDSGWDDYSILFHFDPSVPLEEFL